MMNLKKIVGLTFLLIPLFWACNEGTSEEQKEQNSPEVQEVPVQNDAALELDSYGRKPGDEHYGHDHPPLDQQGNPGEIQVETPGSTTSTPAPTSGEADSYGRMPGHAHYGHDHGLLDEENKQTGTQATPTGEADKYGRKPGHEHYGHDHE